MSSDETSVVRQARVIVVGNEKGGSGKSTVAMHISAALLKLGYRVATVDLDTRQKSFTNYIENRRTWAARRERALEMPDHICLEAGEVEMIACTAFADKMDTLVRDYDFVIIDTPGHFGSLSRLAHSMANTLVTPLNDSFVDFDVLGNVDPSTFAVTGTSHYAQMVSDIRQQREPADNAAMDWIVLRNRLSMTNTRNKRMVGQAIDELARMLDFRCVEGFAERMIFREFFPRGLTALDDLNEATLGTRPTMSHATARQEVAALINAMGLGAAKAATPAPATETSGEARNAA